ncbi:MAG: HlyD family efflux transporter periplasmic adaptor subunit [Actinobacteria bacterium]|nr:HlyD family efflux transporter periplasmic adaptor subunit [Actinomycetota bacterium]
MTWENRLRLFVGVLGVVLLVGALTLVFNQRQNRITSFTGQVTADVYTVGADHAGTVIGQYVEPGEEVQPGQRLFTVQSLQLKEDLANGLEIDDTDAYAIDAKRGTITYYAVVAGEISALNARVGNSVPAGAGLAEITAAGNRSVSASFRLLPRDYARVVSGTAARILLPDGEILDGTVETITAETGESGTISKLRISSAELVGASASLTNPGAPVTVSVDLVDSGPLAGVSDLVTDFLIKIGLR